VLARWGRNDPGFGAGGALAFAADDIAQAVLFALTSTFLTGQTLHIDGGEPLT
jgi:NAD(P)-dependent dehydrogenase (short-subunit alcohol dehydrogenase family)